MIDPPELDSSDGVVLYLKAVKEVTGVYHFNVAHSNNVEKAMRHVRYDWPIFFTESQQLVIITKMVELRLTK